MRLWILLFSLAHAEEDPLRQHFDRARALFEQRVYHEAAQEYQLAFDAGAHPAVLFEAGECYRLAGNPRPAVAAYRKFLQLVPESPNRTQAMQHLVDLEPLAGPEPPPPPPPAPPPYMPQPLPQELPGWSLGAGVYGIIASTAVLGLAIGSEITRTHDESLPLGATATLVHIISVPIVAGGGSSVRGPMRVRGNLGLRITGWIAYGLCAIDAIALVTLGALDIAPPEGVITSVGALGFLSGLSMSIDTLKSRSQAQARLAPSVTLNMNGGVMGLSGRF